MIDNALRYEERSHRSYVYEESESEEEFYESSGEEYHGQRRYYMSNDQQRPAMKFMPAPPVTPPYVYDDGRHYGGRQEQHHHKLGGGGWRDQEQMHRSVAGGRQGGREEYHHCFEYLAPPSGGYYENIGRPVKPLGVPHGDRLVAAETPAHKVLVNPSQGGHSGMMAQDLKWKSPKADGGSRRGSRGGYRKAHWVAKAID